MRYATARPDTPGVGKKEAEYSSESPGHGWPHSALPMRPAASVITSDSTCA
jgi:hypothetical protein